ncbi:unnamed protein product [Protopolystoma xenopodis]|uniref:Uncharacterized protein n=1 Tax=Protopolystoma xenopodis TaxID=117903 RepID=A0A3S4ZY20_9PLAT|nr:unnamed protein product [Protopolystoma xenopodis]
MPTTIPAKRLGMYHVYGSTLEMIMQTMDPGLDCDPYNLDRHEADLFDGADNSLNLEGAEAQMMDFWLGHFRWAGWGGLYDPSEGKEKRELFLLDEAK